MYAVIKTGGKQYKVAAGEKIKIEQIAADVDQEITIDQVLAIGAGADLTVGTPFVSGASVTATVVARLRVHRTDLNFGEVLAMTLPLLIVLATAHLEDAHLVMPAVSHDGDHHGCARYQGSPDLQVSAVADCQHLVDRDLLANIRSNLFYFDLFACSNLVLLAAGFYDRVHISPFD